MLALVLLAVASPLLVQQASAGPTVADVQSPRAKPLR
jgi:hypothetical protein